MAPVISAGVMMANISWNAMNTRAGMVRLEAGHGRGRIAQLARKAKSKSPMNGIVTPEGQAEADGGPQHADQAHGEEVLHEHAEHVLAPDHAAVEEGQARGHEQHQGAGHQHPGGVPRVELHVPSSRSSVRRAQLDESLFPDGFPHVSRG